MQIGISGEIRRGTHGRFELRQGLGFSPLTHQGEAQRLTQRRSGRDRPERTQAVAQHAFRTDLIAPATQQVGKVRRRRHEARLDAERLAERRLGRLRLATLQQQVAEIELRLRTAEIMPQCSLILGERRVERGSIDACETS